MNFIDPTGELLGAISTGLGVTAVVTFLYQAYKAIKTGEKVREFDKNLYDEADKGFPDSEHAEKLQEDRHKVYIMNS